jgi:hypothetical protein
LKADLFSLGMILLKRVPELQRERSSPLDVFSVRVFAIDATHQPQRAHAIPSAAAEFANNFEAPSNKSLSQPSVLEPAKKGKTCRGVDKNSAGVSWPGFHELKQRRMMSAEVDTRTDPQQIVFRSRQGFRFVNGVNGSAQNISKGFRKSSGVIVVHRRADDADRLLFYHCKIF